MILADIILLVALVLLVALSVASYQTAGKRGWGGDRLAFGLALGAAMVAGRWESLSRNRPWCNPDEAQMIAGALTLRQAPVFWRDVDGTTHGPLDQWPLTIASWVGLPLDFTGARIFSLGCTMAMLLLMVRLWSNTNESVGRLALLPATAWLVTLREPEFHQLSSEHVPLALLAAACFAGFGSRQPPTGWRAGIFGALLAAIPLAKLQAAPLAAALGGCWLLSWKLAPSAPRRTPILVLLGGMVMAVLVLGPTFVAGAGNEFWISYVQANKNYAFGGAWDPPWPQQVWGLRWLLAITGGLTLLAGVLRGRALVRHWAFQLGVASTGAALFAIFLPGYPILHYWLLLVPALVMLSGAAIDVWLAQAPARPLVLALAIVITTPFVLKAYGANFPRWQDQLEHPPAVSDRTNAAIQALSGRGDSLAVWGWAPELYVLNQRRQATREAHTFGQIQPGPLQAHLRARFLADLVRNRPAVFVDAVHPGAFSYNDRTRHAHEIFPALGEWLETHYDFVGDYDGHRIYRRRESSPAAAPLRT